MITAVLSPENEIWRIGEAVAAAGGRPVLVGGWVRDDLLGQPRSKDFDLEVFGLAPNKLRKVLGDFGPVHAVGKQFGVLKLTTREAEYDVSLPRREVNTGEGHKGFRVRTDPGMGFEEAASRRELLERLRRRPVPCACRAVGARTAPVARTTATPISCWGLPWLPCAAS